MEMRRKEEGGRRKGEGGRRKEEGGEDVRTWTKQVDISFPHLREPVHSEWHPLRYTRALV